MLSQFLRSWSRAGAARSRIVSPAGAGTAFKCKCVWSILSTVYMYNLRVKNQCRRLIILPLEAGAATK
jgi:hypothetical protein